MTDTLAQSGVPQSRIAIVPPFVPDLPAIEATRSTGTSQVVFVGRVVREKGLQLLVRACKMISAGHRLIIVGDGPYRETIEKQVAEERLTHEVTFLGWTPPAQLSSQYQSAAVVAVPSIWPEPFGLIGPEAMSHCRPVVAFDVGGISDWLEDGQSGFLVRPGDVNGLAQKLELLLTEPTLAQEMGRRGRKIVEHSFGPERHLSGLLGAYHAAVDTYRQRR